MMVLFLVLVPATAFGAGESGLVLAFVASTVLIGLSLGSFGLARAGYWRATLRASEMSFGEGSLTFPGRRTAATRTVPLAGFARLELREGSRWPEFETFPGWTEVVGVPPDRWGTETVLVKTYAGRGRGHEELEAFIRGVSEQMEVDLLVIPRAAGRQR